MEQKVYFTIVVTLVIIALLIPFVFATMPMEQMEKEEKDFFEVDGTDKTAGSTLEMTINLDTIDYSNFIFTLETSEETFDVDTSEVENAELEETSKSITITGNKEDMNVSTIKLYYQIPEDLATGTTLIFYATLTENLEEDEEEADVESQEEQQSSEAESEPTDTEGGTTSTEAQTTEADNQDDEKSIEITITVVEEETEKNDTNEQEDKNTELEQSQNNKGENEQEQTTQSANQNSSLITEASTESSKSSSQEETVTYNGSSNNYLETLSVTGYEFTQDFMKENTTYFVKIGEDTTSLTVNATVEDDTATICIYGNEDIAEGSKILISVTAENGNVRTYRIYVV